jgi:hypothetical protein
MESMCEMETTMRKVLGFSPEAAALLGLPADATTSVDLPDDFNSYSPEQRRAWARQQIEDTAVEILRDVGAMHGKVPSQEQIAEYLHNIAPGINMALVGVGR